MLRKFLRCHEGCGSNFLSMKNFRFVSGGTSSFGKKSTADQYNDLLLNKFLKKVELARNVQKKWVKRLMANPDNLFEIKYQQSRSLYPLKKLAFENPNKRSKNSGKSTESETPIEPIIDKQVIYALPKDSNVSY